MSKAPDIPKDLSGVTYDWALNLALHLNGISKSEERHKVVQIEIDRHEAYLEGALSDITKVFVHLEIRKDPGSMERTVMYNWFVKVVPTLMKGMVQKHDLFQREITFYKEVVPLLSNFAKNQCPGFKLKHFRIPKFYYGETSANGNGVLVLEDCAMKGFRIHDASNQLFDLEHLKESLMSLAEFHALSISYDLANQRQLSHRFPIFAPNKIMWLQDDMMAFLSDMTQAANEFLQCIPEQQDLASRFESALSNPGKFLANELSRSQTSKFRCLQHGDSWPNNFIFHRSKQILRCLAVDWQISFFGHAPSDVCYLVYSSTTKVFRDSHLEELLNDYFELLTRTIRSLGIHHELFDGQIEDFKAEFHHCLGWCLLFCGGVEIFKMDPMEGEIYFEENIKEDNELDGNELNEESQHCIDGCAAPNDINEDELETREQPLLSTGDFPDPKNNFSLDPNLEVEEQETRTLDGSIVDPKTTLDHNDSLKDQIKSSKIVSPDTIVEEDLLVNYQRRPSILTDQQVQALEQPYGYHRSLNTRTKRALRRKNYLDICQEAIHFNII